ncbi:hypothetical protein BGZ83_001707 [Gryganskiella cystojenkinii]|nr:hypothetical protein BGZ83_001707 [Gryganskiella cystojenkinii]
MHAILSTNPGADSIALGQVVKAVAVEAVAQPRLQRPPGRFRSRLEQEEVQEEEWAFLSCAFEIQILVVPFQGNQSEISTATLIIISVNNSFKPQQATAAKIPMVVWLEMDTTTTIRFGEARSRILLDEDRTLTATFRPGDASGSGSGNGTNSDHHPMPIPIFLVPDQSEIFSKIELFRKNPQGQQQLSRPQQDSSQHEQHDECLIQQEGPHQRGSYSSSFFSSNVTMKGTPQSSSILEVQEDIRDQVL